MHTHFPFSPFLRGEGRDEGQEFTPTFAYAAAPHPNPLPASAGRGEKWLLAAREETAVVVEVIAVQSVEIGADGDAEIAARAGVNLAQELRLGA